MSRCSPVIPILTVLLALPASATGADWSSQILNLEPAREGRPPVISAVALHPEGNLLALAGDDHCVRVWDLTAGKVVLTLSDHADWVRSLEYSPSGNVLASAASDGQIVLWDAETGDKLRDVAKLPFAVTIIRFSPDGKSLAAAGFAAELHVFDVPSGEPRLRLNSPCLDMRALAFSHEGPILAGGGRNGLIRLWSLTDGPVLQEYAAHRQRIRGLAFSPQGDRLISCGEDGTIRVSRLDGQEDFLLECLGAKIMAVAFCGPDQLATGGSDNLIRIWDMNERREVSQLAGHTGSVVTLTYSGNTLVSSGFDTTVRIWKRDNHIAEDPREATKRVGTRSPFFEINRP